MEESFKIQINPRKNRLTEKTDKEIISSLESIEKALKCLQTRLNYYEIYNKDRHILLQNELVDILWHFLTNRETDSEKEAELKETVRKLFEQLNDVLPVKLSDTKVKKINSSLIENKSANIKSTNSKNSDNKLKPEVTRKCVNVQFSGDLENLETSQYNKDVKVAIISARNEIEQPEVEPEANLSVANLRNFYEENNKIDYISDEIKCASANSQSTDNKPEPEVNRKRLPTEILGKFENILSRKQVIKLQDNKAKVQPIETGSTTTSGSKISGNFEENTENVKILTESQLYFLDTKNIYPDIFISECDLKPEVSLKTEEGNNGGNTDNNEQNINYLLGNEEKSLREEKYRKKDRKESVDEDFHKIFLEEIADWENEKIDEEFDKIYQEEIKDTVDELNVDEKFDCIYQEKINKKCEVKINEKFIKFFKRYIENEEEKNVDENFNRIYPKEINNNFLIEKKGKVKEKNVDEDLNWTFFALLYIFLISGYLLFSGFY